MRTTHRVGRSQKGSEDIMAKPRVTATDRLANVIEVVELGQRTGMLSVERGSGSVLEEGELYFLNGRVIYASLAGLRGREALTALSRWGTCRFSFDRDSSSPSPNITGALPPVETPQDAWRSPSTNPGASPSGYPGGSQPGYPSPRSGDLSNSWPMYPADGAGNGAMNGGMMGGSATFGASLRHPLPPATTPSNGHAGDFLNRRPRRAPDVRDLMTVVTTHNLSRAHRTILLLADGEHTVLDLARLSSKSVDEVSALLNELETRGLIYYY